MKALTYSEIKHLVDGIRPLVITNHIANITVVNSNDFLLSFSYYKKEKLLLSINHSAPIIGMVSTNESIPTIMGKYNEIFRNQIKDTTIKDIAMPYNDRIVVFSLQKTDDFYEKHYIYLVFELIPQHPNILILDSEKKVIFATHFTSLNDKRIILKGMTYEAPNNMSVPTQEIREDLQSEIKEYFSLSTSTRGKEKYLELGKYIQGKIKISKKKMDVLNKEIELAKQKLIYEEWANILLTYQNDHSELEKVIKENNIKLDSNLSIQENINHLFKQYKKNKLTISNDIQQLKENERALNELEIDYEIFSSGDENKIQLLKNKYPKLIKANKQIVINKHIPFYFEINGTRYAYGKNQEQNDFLTFKIANENHYFFHIKDYQGAHVVLMKDNPTDEEKELASELAIYASKKDIGEVQIAKIKTIKKGHFAGQVIFSNYETVLIKKIDERIKEGVKSSSRFSF